MKVDFKNYESDLCNGAGKNIHVLSRVFTIFKTTKQKGMIDSITVWTLPTFVDES